MNRRLAPFLLVAAGLLVLILLFVNRAFGTRVGIYIFVSYIIVGIPAQILATKIGKDPAHEQDLAIEELGLEAQPGETAIDLWMSPKRMGAIWKMKRAKLFIGPDAVRYTDTSELEENASKSEIKLGNRPNAWNSFVKLTFPSGRTLLLSQVGPSDPQGASVEINRKLREQIAGLLVQ